MKSLWLLFNKSQKRVKKTNFVPLPKPLATTAHTKPNIDEVVWDERPLKWPFYSGWNETADHFLSELVDICWVNEWVPFEQKVTMTEEPFNRTVFPRFLSLPSFASALGLLQGRKERNWCTASLKWVKESHKDGDLMRVFLLALRNPEVHLMLLFAGHL